MRWQLPCSSTTNRRNDNQELTIPPATSHLASQFVFQIDPVLSNTIQNNVSWIWQSFKNPRISSLHRLPKRILCNPEDPDNRIFKIWAPINQDLKKFLGLPQEVDKIISGNHDLMTFWHCPQDSPKINARNADLMIVWYKESKKSISEVSI